MLEIVQGPLPTDGQTVDPSTFLEAWIAGTTVTNLPVGAFTGGELQFVVSATDAPATAERTVGMLWFARGEGILYIYDPASAVSEADWLAIGGRRDLWVQNADHNLQIPIGCPLGLDPNTPATAVGSLFVAGESQTSELFRPRFKPVWRIRPFTLDTAGVSAAGYPSEWLVIAREAALAQGEYFRAVELGFCDILVASGYTGAGGFFGLDTAGSADTKFDNFNANSASPVTEVSNITLYGILCDSSATAPASRWLRRGFKLIQPPITDTPSF